MDEVFIVLLPILALEWYFSNSFNCNYGQRRQAVAMAMIDSEANLSDRELKEELMALGLIPGPITDSTRPLYMKKLNELKTSISSRQYQTLSSANQDNHVQRHVPSLTVMNLSDSELRMELTKLGFIPGPITDGTRALYWKKLCDLKKQT